MAGHKAEGGDGGLGLDIDAMLARGAAHGGGEAGTLDMGGPSGGRPKKVASTEAVAGASAPGMATEVEAVGPKSTEVSGTAAQAGGRAYPPSPSSTPDVDDVREAFVVPDDAILKPMLKRRDDEELVVVSGKGGKGGKVGRGAGGAAGGSAGAISSTIGISSSAAVAEDASGSTGPPQVQQPDKLEDVEPAEVWTSSRSTILSNRCVLHLWSCRCDSRFLPTGIEGSPRPDEEERCQRGQGH